MKKQLLPILTLALGVLGLASCQKDVVDNTTAPTQMVSVVATISSEVNSDIVGSRTAYDPTENKVLLKEGESVSISAARTGDKTWTAATDENGAKPILLKNAASGGFEVSFKHIAVPNAISYDYFFVHPAEVGGIKGENTSSDHLLPQAQSPTEDGVTFDPQADILIGGMQTVASNDPSVAADLNVRFKRLFVPFKVTISDVDGLLDGGDVKSVLLEAPGADGWLTGEFEVNHATTANGISHTMYGNSGVYKGYRDVMASYPTKLAKNADGTYTVWYIVNPTTLRGDVTVTVTTPTRILTCTITPGDTEIAVGKINTVSLALNSVNTTIEVDNTLIDLSDPNKTGQSTTANCYVAGVSGQTYSFPATMMGNGYTTPATADYTGNGIADGIIPTKLAPQSAQLLWQTSKGLISDVKLKSGYIYFTLNGSENVALTEGNASIAIFDQKNGGGNILWSWHIWVTAADLNSNIQTYVLPGDHANAGVTAMMDRNLGALDNKYFAVNNNNQSLGLLYQWGRKDPFLSIDDAGVGVTNNTFLTQRVRKSYDASDNELSTTQGTALSAKSWVYAMGTAIAPEDIARYPMNAAWDANANWLGESRDDLWGNPFSAEINQTGRKSIYDPCPPGYRVCHRYTGTMFTTTGANTKVLAEMTAVNPTATVRTNGGQIFKYNGSETTYYPACGMLFNDGTTFAPYRVGGYGGWYWTSMATKGTHKAYGFSFDYSNGTPVYNNSSAVGMGIRCMKE